jgi:hypothetical protein
LLFAAALAVSFAAPALAADEFFVVQDSATKKCTIVSQRPTTTTTTVIEVLPLDGLFVVGD